jgi:uncharacterized membrane protein YgaE (UPF0421/DUF939 family)
MVILNQQVTELVADVAADMTNGQGGTGTTLFLKTQTGLITAVVATDIALVDKTNTTSVIFVNHFLDTSTGNGSTLTEFEVNNTVISYNRTVKAPFAKTSSNEYNIFHSFTFEVAL